MKQAADNLLEQEQPKNEYRDAFLAEWNRWKVGNDETKKVPLDDNWKQSIERFRIAGIPTWMWAEIVDIGMGNNKVPANSTFRYCCGIAWNKVAELQAEARRIVGASPAGENGPDALESAFITGAVALWSYISCRDPEPDERADLERSALAALHAGEDPLRVIKAGEWAAYFGKTIVAEGLAAIDNDERRGASIAWINAWISTGATFPDEDSQDVFEAHCEALYSAGAGLPEMRTAGFVAGFHRSTVPHYGIAEAHLEAAGIRPSLEQATDIWVRSYRAATGKWPLPEDKRKVVAQLDRMTDEGGFKVGDAFGAAVAAGANQETDLYWNLPRQLGAIFAAATPFTGGEL